MNLTLIKNAVTSKVGLAVLSSQKHSPAILFGAGVIGMVGTVVLASRATLQLDAVVEEFEAKRELSIQARTDYPEKYTDQMAKSDGVVLRTHLILDVARLYAPAVGLGVLSIGALGGSHYILTKRNAALGAAYAAIDKAFKEYRGRVVADLGEDKDRDYMYGTSEREVYSQTKKGEPKVEVVKTFGTGRSPYAKVFDSDNLNWQDTPEYNAYFLRLTQNYLNDRLRAKGHVFLNDVYRELGMEDTEEGAVTGWIWNSETGDNFIDFGIWTNNTLDDIKEFMRNGNGAILLDFNVDGLIFKKLNGKKG